MDPTTAIHRQRVAAHHNGIVMRTTSGVYNCAFYLLPPAGWEQFAVPSEVFADANRGHWTATAFRQQWRLVG